LSNSGLGFRGRRERSASLGELLLRGREVGIGLRSTRQVLVGVEATDGGNVSDVRQLQEVASLIRVVEIAVRVEIGLGSVEVATGRVSLTLLTSVASAVVLGLRVAHLLGHGRQSDALGKVGERIDEASLLSRVVVEGASVTEFAGTSLLPKLAGNGLVVGVNRAESSFTEILGKRIIGLSQLSGTVSELAVLVERTREVIGVVSAQLSLILLLQSVELALVAVEVVIVALLSEMTKNLTRRVVEVLLTTVLILGGFFASGVSTLVHGLARERVHSGSGSTLSKLLALAEGVTFFDALLLCRSLRVRRTLVCRGSCIRRVSYLSSDG
jgi:hypothetical protein